jgi:glutamate--cysteine ligase
MSSKPLPSTRRAQRGSIEFPIVFPGRAPAAGQLMDKFGQRLKALTPAVLQGIRRGIEKEGLRVRVDGTLATTPHPVALGSALTHPHIITDYSEAQLELITGTHTSVESCLDELKRIHQFVYRNIGDEVMWSASMPCYLPSEQEIPIGRYGTSNVGTAKTVYRTGLAYRYGKRMQTISGLHYNFSLPEAAWPLDGLNNANDAYFALIRNFRRNGWLLMHLFGASPAVCASFVQGRPNPLQELSKGTRYLPNATSLRMGRLGYLSEAQDSLAVSYNCLDDYTASLFEALTKPYPPYEAIGIGSGSVGGDTVDGYRQLATSLLQIENEFYSTIRPKRVIRPAERPLHALRERGVEYVEVRAMDLDPFSAIGIAPDTARFLDVFLLHCLISDSPQDTPQELGAFGRNKQDVASRGREPGLQLERFGRMVNLVEWGSEVLSECNSIAAALDAAMGGGSAYRQALAGALATLKAPVRLPSARMLAEIRQSYNDAYGRFALAKSIEHRATLRGEAFSMEEEARFSRMARESIEEQRRVEAADTVPFETYRQRYLSHESLIPDSGSLSSLGGPSP